MKKTLILICILAVALVCVQPAKAQEGQGVWRDTSPVYVCTQTSQGLLVFEFDALPADYQLPTGYYYRATLPEPDLIVACYPAYIVAGAIEFGPAIFVSTLFVGNFVSFETFYFREFRGHWHSCWRAHPHWRHFDSRHHAQFAKHKNAPLFNKLAGHPGFRGDKRSSGPGNKGLDRGKGHPGVGKSDGHLGGKQSVSPVKGGPPPGKFAPSTPPKDTPAAHKSPPPKSGMTTGKSGPPPKGVAPEVRKSPPPPKAGSSGPGVGMGGQNRQHSGGMAKQPQGAPPRAAAPRPCPPAKPAPAKAAPQKKQPNQK